MKKTLRITIDVDLRDLTREEKADLREDGDDGPYPGLRDTEVDEIARCVAECLSCAQTEIWAGSMIYAHIEHARLVQVSPGEPQKRVRRRRAAYRLSPPSDLAGERS